MIEVVVAEKRRETADVSLFELVPSTVDALPPFAAGAHVDVRLAHGLVRQYSLCNHPDEKHRYVIAVMREVNSRGGSASLHDEVKRGDKLLISEPRNHFPLVPASAYRLFAGGIGVTPILCMAERLASARLAFEMHYCARSREKLAFADRIRSSTFANKVHLHLDTESGPQQLDLDAAIGIWSEAVDSETHIYVCGPGGFIDHIVNGARQRGWPAHNLHVEHFGSVLDQTVPANAFQVRIASTGQVIDVPADQSVAQVLLDAGFDLALSCEQGVCGTCVTGVLSGTPEHRDVCLSDSEHAANDRFTPCCSRSLTPFLVLDM